MPAPSAGGPGHWAVWCVLSSHGTPSRQDTGTLVIMLYLCCSLAYGHVGEFECPDQEALLSSHQGPTLELGQPL